MSDSPPFKVRVNGSRWDAVPIDAPDPAKGLLRLRTPYGYHQHVDRRTSDARPLKLRTGSGWANVAFLGSGYGTLPDDIEPDVLWSYDVLGNSTHHVGPFMVGRTVGTEDKLYVPPVPPDGDGYFGFPTTTLEATSLKARVYVNNPAFHVGHELGEILTTAETRRTAFTVDLDLARRYTDYLAPLPLKARLQVTFTKFDRPVVGDWFTNAGDEGADPWADFPDRYDGYTWIKVREVTEGLPGVTTVPNTWFSGDLWAVRPDPAVYESFFALGGPAVPVKSTQQLPASGWIPDPVRVVTYQRTISTAELATVAHLDFLVTVDPVPWPGLQPDDYRWVVGNDRRTDDTALLVGGGGVTATLDVYAA